MVRLPIPSQRQLDRARRLFSSWERQNVLELFRVPFFMGNRGKFTEDGAPKEAGARGRAGGPNLTWGAPSGSVPNWFAKEKEVDEGRPVESFMPAGARGHANCPEHFEVFRTVQCEYWPFDVYARVCMFLSWMTLTSAWGYFQMGHTITETRAIWAAVCVPIPLFVAQNVLITLDICSPRADCF